MPFLPRSYLGGFGLRGFASIDADQVLELPLEAHQPLRVGEAELRSARETRVEIVLQP